MSDDSLIVIFDHPHGYGVVHTGFSGFPGSLNDIIKKGKHIYPYPDNSKGLQVLSDHEKAKAYARKIENLFRQQGYYPEYGIADRGNPDRKFIPGRLAR